MREQARSVSQLLDYSRCGKAYQLQRINRVDQLPAGWTIQGRAVHRAVEAYERSDRRMSTEDAQQVFSTTWEVEVSAARERQPDLSMWLRGGRKSTEKDLAERHAAGLKQIADYIAYTQQEPLVPMRLPDGSPATEVGFTTEIGGVPVLGFVDLVLEDPCTGEVLVRDLKTGAKPPFSPIQLKVYQLGLQDALGVDVRWGDYYMARHGAPTNPIDLDACLSPNFLEQWLRDMDASENDGRYLPNPSADNCTTCSVKHHCPVMAYVPS